MSQITSEMIKKLREMTGAGMMDCKGALNEAEGSIDKAIEVLRKKGLKDIEKRSAKTAAEGTLGVYIHPGDQVVSVVELNCETDFVGRGDEFRALARDLAMHVAAMKPVALSSNDVPADLVARERSVAAAKAAEDAAVATAAGKPIQSAEIVAKRIEGGVQKYLKEVSLFNQTFVKNDKQTVEQMLKATGTTVKSFTLFVVGEGIEKKVDDFAAEVAAQVAAAQQAA